MDKVIGNPEKFTRLVSLLKANHVKTFELGDMKITLSDYTPPTTGEPKIDYPAAVSDEQKKKEEEEVLFWSAGA